MASMLVNYYQLHLSEKKLSLEEVRDPSQDQRGREVIDSDSQSQSAEIAVTARLFHGSYFSLMFISLQCVLLRTVASYLYFLWNPWHVSISSRCESLIPSTFLSKCFSCVWAIG